MFNGKMKALTFSYDDGMTQDIKLVEMLNKYGLKCTFNVNTGGFGSYKVYDYQGKPIQKQRLTADECVRLYKGHEVATHTVNHPNLTELEEKDIIYQVGECKKELERLFGYEVPGMAYPCGGVNNDDRVAEIIGKLGVKYSRTITSTFNFDLQDNLLRFNPTVYHRQKEQMFKLAEEFINLKPTEPKIFYIWGHSYEFDFEDGFWEDFEKLCQMLSNKDDIFYGTNSEVLLNK